MFLPRSNVVRLGILAIVLGPLVAWASCQRTYQDLTPGQHPSRVDSTTRQQPIVIDSGIAGQIVWPGEPPDVPKLRGLITSKDGLRWGEVPNHFAPRIDPKSNGVGDTVVYIKAATNDDWNSSPLVVEQTDFAVRVRQRERTGRIGFVRVGDEIEMTSRDPEYHSLRARGAAYFTLPFPEPIKPIRRKFDTPGHIEFTSAAGYFWSAADVFVCEHPHYTTTDTDGRFELKNVPPGEYELIAWLRNWQVLDRERDPETGRIMRVKFAEPFQITRTIRVVENQTTKVDIPIGR